MREQRIKELFSFEANHVWVSENLEALLKQCAEQWIAVDDAQVIASDPDFEDLLSKLQDSAHTCIEFITRAPLEIVL